MQKNNQSLNNPLNTAQQQNISINISYNLNTHKIPKSILGSKKTSSKSKKITAPPFQSIGNQFFSNMGFNPLNQPKKPPKKQNLSKKSNQVSIPIKQSKPINQKKSISKKKKSKQIPVPQPNFPPADTVIQYYNPLANNSKNFLKRNIQSPDIFKVQVNRKLKTQASNYEPNQSTFKKLKKSTGNTKDNHNGLLSKNTKINNFFKQTGFNLVGTKGPSALNTILRKPTLSSKTPKNRKSSHTVKQKQKRIHTQQNEIGLQNPINQTRHNKSCMLYSTKKPNIITQPHLIQTAEHILSTYVSVNSNKLPRKRAQSAYSFNRNGKQLVSKLLNMSMISSQLGSSQLISSERIKSGRNNITRKKLGLKVDEFDQFNHYQNVLQNEQSQQKIKPKKQNQQVIPGYALRQYLNSIDLRIIKNIQSDTANIIHNSQQKVQKTQRKQKQVQRSDFQQKLNKYKKLQKQRQQKQRQQPGDIVSFYNKLFSNALHNKRLQQQQQKYLNSANHLVQSGRNSILENNNSMNSFSNNNSIDFNKTSKIKKQKFFINGFDSQQPDQSNQKTQQRNKTINEKQQSQQKQIYQFVKSSKPQGTRKLNFQHYKDLLNKKGQNQKKQIKNQIKQINDNLNSNKLNKKQLQQQKNNTMKFNFQLINCENQFDFTNQQHKQQISSDLQQQDLHQSNSYHKYQQKGQSKQQQQKCQLKQQDIDSQQKAIIDLIDRSFKSSSSPQSSSLSQFKQQQIQKWNHANQLYNKTYGEKVFKQSKRQQIMNQIIKQSTIHNKWVQQNSKNQSESQSQLISQSKSDQRQQKVQKKPLFKSPKISNKQKFSGIDAQYTEVCWEYNPDEFQNQNKQSINNKLEQKKSNKNIINSPNNISQDGHGSGQQEYDSKKYSQVSQRKDQVIEQNQSNQFYPTQNKKSQKLQKQKITKQKELIDSFDQDDEDLSFQQKQIGSDNRWINSNYQTDHFGNQQGRIKKFVHSNKQQQTQKQPQDNYLQCSLSDFGVKKIDDNNFKGTCHIQITSIQVQPEKSKQKSHNQKIVNNEQNLIQKQNAQSIQGHFKLTINGKQTNQKITIQVDDNKHNAFFIIRRNRQQHIVQDIILQLIRQFAKDISYILKKSSYQKRTQQQFDQNSSPLRNYQQGQENQLSPFSRQMQALDAMPHQNNPNRRQARRAQFVGRCFGIDTSFLSVQKYLKQFKQYLLKDQNLKKSIIKNINKDIGPNSLQILSYLRPQYENMDNSGSGQDFDQNQIKQQNQDNCQDQDGLFVVPSQAFSDFQTYLEQKLQQKNKSLDPDQQIILTQKQKRNTNFWHRGIYQSWNQFLDYERPYGINGKPYEWVKQKKKFRQVTIDQVDKKLQKGIDKLLQAISLPSGIIYDKYDLPPMYSDLNQDQKMFLNQQRLSRMLAIELFESEQTWINYNDEMAELLVQLSRILEDRIFFELTAQLKKVWRKRNLLNSEKVNSEIKQEENKQERNENEQDQQWLVDEASQC